MSLVRYDLIFLWLATVFDFTFSKLDDPESFVMALCTASQDLMSSSMALYWRPSRENPEPYLDALHGVHRDLVYDLS